MTKKILIVFLSLALSLFPYLIPTGGVSAQTTGSGLMRVIITKHLCPSSIQSESDFNAIGNFVDKITRCPTVVKKVDSPVKGAVTGGKADFNFSLTYQTPSSTPQVMLQQTRFLNAKLCETDLNTDINKDGKISPGYCLDNSSYVYDNVNNGTISIIETTVPDMQRLGAVEFVPANAGGSGQDQSTFVSLKNSTVTLDSSNFTGDKISLHLFNFTNAGSTIPSSTPISSATTTANTVTTAPVTVSAGQMTPTTMSGYFTTPGTVFTSKVSGTVTIYTASAVPIKTGSGTLISIPVFSVAIPVEISTANQPLASFIQSNKTSLINLVNAMLNLSTTLSLLIKQFN